MRLKIITHTFVDTSATKFLVFGSDSGGRGPNGGTPCMILPSITPDRRRWVRARVSTSQRPGTPREASQEPSERRARQWQALVLISPTIRPAAHIRLDSNHLQIVTNMSAYCLLEQRDNYHHCTATL